jgi:hypothetical protein
MKSFNLLLVGNGAWSNKIKHTVENADICPVHILPARELDQQNLDALGSEDIVWIATKPSLQVSLLRNLDFKNIKLILEKPIFTNSKDYSNISKTKLNTSRIWISEPWTYSEIWQKEKLFPSIKHSKVVHIKRGGPIRRSYIQPWLDWCYHDLLLIFDLLSYTDQEPNFSELQLTGEFLNGVIATKDYEFQIEIGPFEEKVGFWNTETFTLDFNDYQKIYEKSQPIINMLLHIEKLENESCFLKQAKFLNQLLQPML